MPGRRSNGPDHVGGISERSLRAVVERNADGIVVVDPDGVVLFANPAAVRLFGAQGPSLIGDRFGFPAVAGESMEVDIPGGAEGRVAEMRVTEVDWEGRPSRLATLRDVTERRAAERLLARRAAEHAAVARLGELGLSGLNGEELMKATCEIVRDTTAADACVVLEPVPGRDELRIVAASGVPHRLMGTHQPTALPPGQAFLRREPVTVEDASRADVAARWPHSRELSGASSISVPVRDHDPGPGVLHALSRKPHAFDREDCDFVESIASLLGMALGRRQFRHQALHDPLTGLANRTLFIDRLELANERARRHRARIAVLFLDIDGFKRINDELGHRAGDEVLKGLARRLGAAVRASDTVARFGGDEFLVLLEEVEGESGAVAIVRRIQAEVGEPFVVDGQSVHVLVTIGVVVSGEREEHAEDLIRAADAAMYRAKQAAPGSHAVFAKGEPLPDSRGAQDPRG